MSVMREVFSSTVNSTTLSMNERFTFLQKNGRPAHSTLSSIRNNIAAAHQASAKNRRLAMQMERRMSAMTNLKTKKKNVRQRLGSSLDGGQGSNVRDRLSLPSRGRGRAGNSSKNRRSRGPGRSMGRSQSVQSLSGNNMHRSRSMQSLHDRAVPHRSRSRSRSRGRTRAPSVGPKDTPPRRHRAGSVLRQDRYMKGNPRVFMQQTFNPQRRKRSDSANFRNRRVRSIGIQKDQETRRTFFITRGRNNSGNFQNRGYSSFQGHAPRTTETRTTITRTIRLTRPNPTITVPTKEELDKELEQYMANTGTQLENELDTLMKENEDVDMTA